MRLFLLPLSFKPHEPLVLTGKDYNYIVRVLRLREGQNLTGRDTQGRTWGLEIKKISDLSCTLLSREMPQAQATTDALPSSRPEKTIVLYQCIPKGRKTDDIIRMATEAGVYRVVLVHSRNCVSDFTGSEEGKFSRYRAVVREAVQQSGSLVPTDVEGVIDISQVPSHFAALCAALKTQGCGLFFHQSPVGEKQKDLSGLLSGFDGAAGILIGSEGGLSDEETGSLVKSGFSPVLLKTNILRCETAAIYAVGAVQTLLETSC